MNGDHMQVRRHDLFQVLKHFGPGKRLAFESVVQKLGTVADAAVLRTVQQRLRIPLFAFPLGDLLLRVGESAPGRRRRCTIRSARYTPAPGQEHQRSQSSAPAQPEMARILIRVGREIDIEPHV